MVNDTCFILFWAGLTNVGSWGSTGFDGCFGDKDLALAGTAAGVENCEDEILGEMGRWVPGVEHVLRFVVKFGSEGDERLLSGDVTD